MTAQQDGPLVSVVIPCFNHGRYLAEAIESVRVQRYPHKEVIVVDDGSVDNTREVAQRYGEVRYVYQPNRGLSAARNTGIAESRGDYLLFLDADDWLLPGALQTGLRHLESDKRLAFVSGGYRLIYVPENKSWDVSREVGADHYRHLLQGNYIGMHASVLFPRWVFKEAQYDTMLKACEDYDLYLRLARNHPVAHHTELMAVYRIHTANMSGNYRLMLRTALEVLHRQQTRLRNEEERDAWRAGVAHFKEYYTQKVYERLLYNARNGRKLDARDILMLWRYNPSLHQAFWKKRSRYLGKIILSVPHRVVGKIQAMFK